MGRIRRFGQFWYEFLVGDDWTAALAVVVALGATALLADGALNPWWFLPVAVAAVLAVSVRREANARRSGAALPPDLTEPPFE
ncbi:MAG TPA: hypothetical protein VLV81_00825 [Acidimicrobiia bacterium]|nr:hypothetical protein [Acidimicrobiia bacterium]